MKDLDVFIEGETIDLSIPTIDFASQSNWYSWFNNPKITRYLEQGMFPNSPKDQEEFFIKQNNNNRLSLIITTKNKKYKGVVSLSSINLEKKLCDIAIVVDPSIEPKISSYAALEAIALITQHGFNVMGMKRIAAGQHSDLEGWQQRMELVGYKIEGIHENKFIKGYEVADTVSIACNYSDFLKLTQRRGSLWDNLASMKYRISKLPAQNFSKKLKIFFDSEREKYYEEIFSI